MGQRRRVVGIGSLDNHARRFPFRRRRLSLFEIFPHRQAFRTVRTHLLSPEPFSGEAGADLQRLYALLAAGRCYVSYDLLGDPAGFGFEGERGGLPIPMGEEVPAGEPVELRARSPVKADIRLLRDGELIARAWDTELGSNDRGPGVYRIEVHRDDRPWVFSNPIYLRPPA